MLGGWSDGLHLECTNTQTMVSHAPALYWNRNVLEAHDNAGNALKAHHNVMERTTKHPKSRSAAKATDPAVPYPTASNALTRSNTPNNSFDLFAILRRVPNILNNLADSFHITYHTYISHISHIRVPEHMASVPCHSPKLTNSSK
jgi:hypothetical protein